MKIQIFDTFKNEKFHNLKKFFGKNTNWLTRIFELNYVFWHTVEWTLTLDGVNKNVAICS